MQYDTIRLREIKTRSYNIPVKATMRRHAGYCFLSRKKAKEKGKTNAKAIEYDTMQSKDLSKSRFR